MGKAAILIAFGAALFVAQGMLSQSETERYTAKAQAGFEEGVVAREIARSGFNVAMGILRENGNKIHKAINEINVQGTGLGYMEGQHQGGTFRVRAELEDGEVVRVTSVGYIGGSFSEVADANGCPQADPFTGEYYSGACHTMADFTGESPIYEYELPSGDPLTAKYECSKLDVEFIESMAGYCSAVYLERILPTSIDGAEDPNDGEPLPPEMLFIPGNNRDGTTLAGVDKYVRGGTQMNFFIGVDENCSTRPTAAGASVDDFPTFAGDVNNPAPYDHIHYALEEEVGKLGDMSETPWAFIERHPDGLGDEASPQRWRIAWEDLHHPEWDDPNSDDPQQSLQALKRLGYDGDGWPEEDDMGTGYRDLRDYWLRSGASDNGHYTSYRPDFSDQVIEVTLNEEADVSLCGFEPEGEVTEPVPEEGGGEEGALVEEEEEPVAEASCACPGRQPAFKVAVWHKLPNQKKGRVICIAPAAVPSHLEQHEDHVICTGE